MRGAVPSDADGRLVRAVGWVFALALALAFVRRSLRRGGPDQVNRRAEGPRRGQQNARLPEHPQPTGKRGQMTAYQTNSGRDRVEVHNRLDKVVLAVTQQDDARAQTELTAADAREIAGMLEAAATTGEQTPGS